MEEIVVDKNNGRYDSRNNCNALIESENNELIVGCKNTVIPESVTSIGLLAFNYCKGIENPVIPEGVTTIGPGAFQNSSVQNVTLPHSLQSIGRAAFSGCRRLQSITIPENVTQIGAGAFQDCYFLKQVNLPESVTELEEKVFYNCTSLETVEVPAGVTRIGTNAFELCENLVSIKLPETVSVIERNAFSRCEKLSEINIPAGVQNIEHHVFYYCKNLKEITIPDSVKDIGNSAFYVSGITGIEIPEGVTSLGDSAFFGCMNLRSVVLPASMKSVGEEAFGNCPELTHFEVKGKDVSFGKDVFGNKVPDGLKESLGKLWPYFTDGSLKKYVVTKRIWPDLPIEQQTEVFMTRQGKPLLSAYSECINKVDEIGEAIHRYLKPASSAKEYNAAAAFVTMFQQSASQKVLNTLYNDIKNGGKKAAKALSVIEEDKPLMQKIANPEEVVTLSREEEIVSSWMGEKNQSLSSLETMLNDYYGLKYSDLPAVLKKDGTQAKPFILAGLLVAHEIRKKSPWADVYDIKPDYGSAGIRSDAGELAEMLDEASFQNAVNELAEKNLDKYVNTKKKYLCYPICRYANEEVMARLTTRAPQWKSSVSGNDAPPLLQLREAVLYSETKAAMLFAERYHQLDEYAQIRGMDPQLLRDQYMSDTGLNEDGVAVYDLGNTELQVTLQDDLSLAFYDVKAEKAVKSVPKRGADEKKYEETKTAVSNLKKNIKKIAKARADLLSEAFLDGREFAAENWKKAYFGNPLLNHVARLVVWQQDGKTFILNGKTGVNYNDETVELTKSPIQVAHPLEMKETDIKAWQKYFVSKGLKQPFEQIWEPVYNKEDIKEDRYEGCSIPLWKFVGKEKHGIIATGFHAYSEEHAVTFTDCDLELDLNWRLDWDSGRDEYVTLGKYKVDQLTRYSNHITALLDKWTITDRIINGDVKVANLLNAFTQAQIAEFVKVATEHNQTDIVAILLDHQKGRFEEKDFMDEFILDL